MKKLGIAIIIIIILISTVILSGCFEEFKTPPSDEECKQIISEYLLENSDFYRDSDTIYLGEWEGTVFKTRTFEWCHTQFPENPEITGTYCGGGTINYKGEVFYEGD